MALPSNPNQGGLPQRPNIPQRPVGGQGEGLPEIPQSPNFGQGSSELADSLREAASQKAPSGDLTSNDRLGQYDFDAQKVGRPARNDYDTEDPFESLSPLDAILDDDDDEPTARQEYASPPTQPEAPSRRQQQATQEFERQQSAPARQESVYKPQAGQLDAKGQNVFIDKDSKKLQAFGGKKSLKVTDLDPRKNTKQRARAFQTFVVFLLVIVIGLGTYNAVIPKPTLTAEDVRQTVQQTVAITDFPIEGGQGFAEDFMQAYLTLGTDPAAQTVLNYYYNGRMIAGSQSYPNRINTRGFGQTILFGPTIYGVQYLTDQSANYTIGALVQPQDTTGSSQATPTPTPAPAGPDQVDAEGNPVAIETNATSAPSAPLGVPDGSTAEWQFFSVNVYYSPETLQFAITPDSPTLIPVPQNLSSTGAPNPSDIGTGEQIEDQNTIKATVQGFMEGYRTSTPQDHIRLDPFLGAEPDVALLNGLGSTYEFANDGVDGAVSYIGYTTLTTELKVLVKVVWEYRYNNEVSTTYSSQYIMTLEPSSNGYTVSKFAPYFYTPEAQ